MPQSVAMENSLVPPVLPSWQTMIVPSVCAFGDRSFSVSFGCPRAVPCVTFRGFSAKAREIAEGDLNITWTWRATMNLVDMAENLNNMVEELASADGQGA